jgi:IMP dehydrogenase
MPKERSSIESRKDVDLKSDFMGMFPLMSSPMKGISGTNLVIEMAKNNCLGILHRFDPIEVRFDNINKIYKQNVPFGIAIGINDWGNELDIAEYAVNRGAVLVCLDIANGYLPQIQNRGKSLRERLGNNIKLMTGNVINEVGALYIEESGFDLIRVSIGSGNVCTTRSMTGIGRNALLAMQHCSNVTNAECVMDGGIRHPGDVVKAFAFGASWAILGSVLAYANEAEDPDGKIWGMASLKNHQLNNKEVKSIEGRDTQIDASQKKPLKEILDDFLWGIKSACTYLNCKSYEEIQYKSQIIDVNEKL